MAYFNSTEVACQMRTMYSADLCDTSNDHLVLTIDNAHNLLLPSVCETPSQWINYSHDFCERRLRKGSNEVISLLQKQLLDNPDGAPSARKLTLYADNCCEQNKNNFVLKFLLALTDPKTFGEVNFRFLVKVHTKNACDRGFAMVRKKLARSDCWVMDELVQVIEAASIASRCVNLEDDEECFLNFKVMTTELYKDLPGITKYQMFRMHHSKLGVVECREGPFSQAVSFDLRRKYDGMVITDEHVYRAWEEEVMAVSRPPPNAEKLLDVLTKIVPYVPVQYKDDPLYKKPSIDEAKRAATLKRMRADARKCREGPLAAADQLH